MSNLDTALVWLNSGLCSQQASHSFWLDGRQLPLCARDLGLFTTFLLAAAFANCCPWPGRPLWLIGLLPLILDGANSFASENAGLSLYPAANALRLATGALAGGCLALAVARSNRRLALCLTPLALLGLANGYLTVALLGTTGAVALVATVNRLARPTLSPALTWAIALPELALLALAKQGLLLALR